jgi:hypothetical protein
MGVARCQSPTLIWWDEYDDRSRRRINNKTDMELRPSPIYYQLSNWLNIKV